MLLTILVILFILWLFGLTVFHLGALINILLVVILIVVVYRLLTGDRRL